LSSRVLLGADKVIWLVSGGGGVDILAQVTKAHRQVSILDSRYGSGTSFTVSLWDLFIFEFDYLEK